MKFHIMDKTGHSTENFAKGDALSAERFNELIGRGMAPFRADGDGHHTRLKSHDPDAETVLWVPQLEGG